jgi:hypothetical protein
MRKSSIAALCFLGFSLVGFQAHAQNTTDCSNPEKRSSKDSTCVTGIGLTTQTPQARNFQTQSIKPFAVAGKSCVTPWGTTVPDNTSVSAFNKSTGTYDPSSGQYAADCLEEDRHCTNGVLSGTYQYQTCTIAPVNGACGPANGAYYTYPTSGPAFADQCNPSYTYGGSAPSTDAPPSVPASSGVYLSNNMYSWTCAGEVGGSTASCSAFLRINGTCGSSTNTCNTGNYAAVSPSSTDNYYPNYKCSCSTNTSGVTSCTPSATGNQTCTGGYKDTTYNWQCTGINTGSTSSCNASQYVSSKNITPPPPCGATYQGQSSSCPSGYTGTQYRTNTVDSCTGNTIGYGSWDQSGCTATCTTSTSTQSASCPSGYSGTQYRTVYNNSCTGTSYGSWDTSGCSVTPPPAPTCTTSSSTESASCPSGYSGTQYRSVNYNSCSGTTYGSWDQSGCSANPPPAPICTTTVTTQRGSCPSGQSGSKYRDVYTNSCTGTTYGAWDSSGCCGGYTTSPGGGIYYQACQ